MEDVGDDLEQVEVLQKKFDDFQADLKANEVRLAEMNEIAVQLMTLGQTEAALRIQTQIQVCVYCAGHSARYSSGCFLCD